MKILENSVSIVFAKQESKPTECGVPDQDANAPQYVEVGHDQCPRVVRPVRGGVWGWAVSIVCCWAPGYLSFVLVYKVDESGCLLFRPLFVYQGRIQCPLIMSVDFIWSSERTQPVRNFLPSTSEQEWECKYEHPSARNTTSRLKQ